MLLATTASTSSSWVKANSTGVQHLITHDSEDIGDLQISVWVGRTHRGWQHSEQHIRLTRNPWNPKFHQIFLNRYSTEGADSSVRGGKSSLSSLFPAAESWKSARGRPHRDPLWSGDIKTNSFLSSVICQKCNFQMVLRRPNYPDNCLTLDISENVKGHGTARM